MKERRKHPRHAMPRGTFVILRKKNQALRNHQKMSIGEIAMVLYKSKSEIMAQVLDISFGGVSFDAKLDRRPDTGVVEMDLLMAEKGIYIHNVPYAPLLETPPLKDGLENPPLRINAFQFQTLGDDHKRQLDEMLSHRVVSS